jgi:hypothetical protein
MEIDLLSVSLVKDPSPNCELDLDDILNVLPACLEGNTGNFIMGKKALVKFLMRTNYQYMKKRARKKRIKKEIPIMAKMGIITELEMNEYL